MKDIIKEFLDIKKVYTKTKSNKFCKNIYYFYKHLVPVKWWIKNEFKRRVGYSLNLSNPKTFNEKMQWLKLYDHRDIYTVMADKMKAKQYIAGLIGMQYVIPTLSVYENVNDIDLENLPQQCVLKTTHDSGGVVIVDDKSKINIEKIKNKLDMHMRYNYYYHAFEWPYKNVEPKIIVEKYLSDGINKGIKDYKVLCFNGEPRLIEVNSNEMVEGQHHQDFYDVCWNKMPISQNIYATVSDTVEKKPDNLEIMINMSKKLADNIPLLRVDWYDINGKLYVGELTFYDGAGLTAFDNKEHDELLGSWINLNQ